MLDFRPNLKENSLIHAGFRYSRALYWLDLGNNTSSGQFVLGQPKNRVNQKKKHRLPTVTELFPEIAVPGVKDDDHPSCSAAEALTRQEPFINQNLAYQALGMFTQLLRRGSVSYQGGFCNLATGQLVPLPISLFGAVREKFYRRRRLVRTLAVTARIRTCGSSDRRRLDLVASARCKGR